MADFSSCVCVGAAAGSIGSLFLLSFRNAAQSFWYDFLYLGLPTWNKQSFACLSSRFVYGETISEEKLNMVDKAEQLLLDLGFHQVRVRIHGTIARIEVLPAEFPKLIQEENRISITASFRQYGFSYVTMDLLGYRTGSMNEILNK